MPRSSSIDDDVMDRSGGGSVCIDALDFCVVVCVGVGAAEDAWGCSGFVG